MLTRYNAERHHDHMASIGEDTDKIQNQRTCYDAKHGVLPRKIFSLESCAWHAGPGAPSIWIKAMSERHWPRYLFHLNL